MFNERIHGGQRSGRRHTVDSDDARRLDRVGEETGDGRLSARAVSRGKGAVRLDVQNLALRSEAIKASRVTRRLSFRQNLRQLAKAIARRRQLALARLCSHELCASEPQV